MRAKVTCGVVVTDGERVILGHSTGNRHWDIPKGVADPGEGEAEAAARELAEETGIMAAASALAPLGRAAYSPEKDLSLFLLAMDPLPDPATLVCRSMVELPGRAPFPELDAFAAVPWDEIPGRAVRRMAERLLAVRPRAEAAALPAGGERST